MENKEVQSNPQQDAVNDLLDRCAVIRKECEELEAKQMEQLKKLK